MAIGLFTNYQESNAQTKTFTVKANEVKASVPATLWGVFFEDINLGADGGIYAELVKNRSFEFDTPLMGWKLLQKGEETGSLLVNNWGELNGANSRFIRITSKTPTGNFGFSNEGFRGMGIKKGNQYDFSVLASQQEGAVSLVIELVNSKGEKLGSTTVTPAGKPWKKYNASFTATVTEPKAVLNIYVKGQGVVDLDMISLFPKDTWKNRPNGMRADLVQLLADMKPGFLRFPGGCIVEGRTLDERFQWKKTIGPVEDRGYLINRWNTEFKHRLTTDYYQSFGLGFYEYFQLAEDIGAEPLPILNCGMACQFNTAEVVPLESLDPYVQDALDLIEFANGSADTKWGKIRSEMGHPAPFNLKMMGVGNENWGEQYIDRLKIFTQAIKAKYPNIQLVNSSGTDPNGERFDYLNGELRKMNADIIDEHYYRAPQWFLDNAKRYDNYDRKGPKIFAGEYAAQSVAIASPDNKNNWQCALSEAAFMTGLERNADVVAMASYAPLFAHAEGWQWTPDMIWVDNLKSYGTPNYQVQKLFSTNKGTNVVPLLLNNETVTGQEGYYASAVLDKNKKEIILKVVNASDKTQDTDFVIDGLNKVAAKGTVTVLRSDQLDQVNSFENPTAISPVVKDITVKNKKVKVALQPYSVNVIKLKFS
ncbi:carbohydrate binding domain-containing protein [Adhaeribacter radiodurans]|uniref:non-reducing end alpha-L-arabinofuranosidase n=2 Tax=Adhaeribacter radiodurans TaxID=2745197 RepID=A0A7L7LG72_9BACT|nr:carbohydrate binding domain-containing protein [Adhaeribacter radiodurans]